VKNGTLSFDVRNDHVEFNSLKGIKFPSIFDTYNKIDAVYGFIREAVSSINSNDLLEQLM